MQHHVEEDGVAEVAPGADVVVSEGLGDDDAAVYEYYGVGPVAYHLPVAVEGVLHLTRARALKGRVLVVAAGKQ